MADLFEQAFELVVGHEGGYSVEAEDPGNWTSGVVGRGVLRGTKYGVSAAAYPKISIADLSLQGAQSIYRRDYWDRIAGDVLPPSLALLAFDAAINNGVASASRWLQMAVGADVDGDLGPQTRAMLAAAVAANTVNAVSIEFQARRVDFMAGLATWRSFGLGWSRRLCALLYQSLTMKVS